MARKENKRIIGWERCFFMYEISISCPSVSERETYRKAEWGCLWERKEKVRGGEVTMDNVYV